MILLIDIGNTRLKWATLEAGQLIPGGSLLYKDIPTDDILWQNWAFPVAPEAVFISSVSSKGVVKAFKQTFLEHWAVEPIRIHLKRSHVVLLMLMILQVSLVLIDGWELSQRMLCMKARQLSLT